jgi:hypothetical protein
MLNRVGATRRERRRGCPYQRVNGLGAQDPRDFTMDIVQGDVDGDGDLDFVIVSEDGPGGTKRFDDCVLSEFRRR